MFAHTTKNFHQENSSLGHWILTNPYLVAGGILLLILIVTLIRHYIVRKDLKTE